MTGSLTDAPQMTGVAFVIITGRGNVRKKRILPLGLGAKKNA